MDSLKSFNITSFVASLLEKTIEEAVTNTDKTCTVILRAPLHITAEGNEDNYTYRLLEITITKVDDELKEPIVNITELTDDEYLDLNLEVMNSNHSKTLSIDEENIISIEK